MSSNEWMNGFFSLELVAAGAFVRAYVIMWWWHGIFTLLNDNGVWFQLISPSLRAMIRLLCNFVFVHFFVLSFTTLLRFTHKRPTSDLLYQSASMCMNIHSHTKSKPKMKLIVQFLADAKIYNVFNPLILRLRFQMQYKLFVFIFLYSHTKLPYSFNVIQSSGKQITETFQVMRL